MVSRKMKAKNGFTIVELILVITIIAILTSITIVAYNGANIKAENTKTASAINQYLKSLTTYATQNGNYPIVNVNACLGAMTDCAKVAGVATCFSTGTVLNNSGFADTVKAIAAPLPELSTQSMSCGGSRYRGGYYVSNNLTNGKTAEVVYFLRGNQTCSTSYGTVSSAQQEDVTRCSVALPTLPS